MGFTDLKKQTFKDIFTCTNKNAGSIKKGLNYANFSKQDYDIITKMNRNPIFKEFNSQVCEYTPIKPPPFDIEHNIKMAKKREKASLDRQSKKYIIKNIKTCTDFAKSQRERSRLEQQYDNFLDQTTPLNLRKRRLQIVRRNRGVNKTTIQEPIEMSPSPLKGFTTLEVNSALSKDRERRNYNNSLNQQSQEMNDGELNEVKLSRFRNNRNDNRQQLFTNPEPITFQNRNYNTIQTNLNGETLKEKRVSVDKAAQAEQMKRRSLSSHCKKRINIQGGKRNPIRDQDSHISVKSLTEMASQAYKETDNKGEKRIKNLERFMNKQKGQKFNAMGYAMNFLDKLAAINSGTTLEPNKQPEILLNNYQWNTKKNPYEQNNSKLFHLDGIQCNNNSLEQLNLKEEENLIDQVLFDKNKIQINYETSNLETEQQQGENFAVQKLSSLETELNEERIKRRPSSKSSYTSQVSSYMNKAKGGGYSKLTQAKQDASNREVLDKMEGLKLKEKQIIREKKQREKEKEQRMAEERLKKINEEQNFLKQKKDKQKEFYTKFLRQTAEQNIKKIEEQQHQNIQKLINEPSYPQPRNQEPINNQTGSSKFQSKIPRPNFSANNQSLQRQIQPPQIMNKDQEKKLVNNLNGLDLELSQTKRQFDFKYNGGLSPKGNGIMKLLDRGDLIESLDLNIGYESIQKLKDNWGFIKPLQSKVEEYKEIKKTVQQPCEDPDFERDSLEDEDEVNQEEVQLKDDELKLLRGGKKSNKEWIENSIRQSVQEWKEVLKFNKENQDNNQEQQKPLTWIDQEYQKNMNQVVAHQQQPVIKQTNEVQLQQKPEEDQFTFGQKLQQLDQQTSSQQNQMKPPKPSVQGGKSSKFDDSKSAISKVSKASSKSSRIQHHGSQSNILSKEEELKQAKEKKEKMDQIKKQYTQVSRVSRSKSKHRSGSQNRAHSPSGVTTKCTREEDINIDEFMKDDLRSINKEEDKLQRELLNIHKQNLHKHHQVVSKHQIDTNIQSTEQLIRKMVNAPSEQSNGNNQKQKKPMRPGVNEALEEQIEESLENLDSLLNNIRSGDHNKKEQEILKIGKKYNIEFNLEGDQQNQALNGYSKSNQSKPFEYQQPFNLNQPQLIAQPQVQNMQQPQLVQYPPPNQKQGIQPQNIQQIQMQNMNQMPIQGSTFAQQPQLNNFQFQPFQNMDIISNLYSQQQRIQQIQTQILSQQQQQQTQQQQQYYSQPQIPLLANNVAPQFQDKYSYNITGPEVTFQKSNGTSSQHQLQSQQEQSARFAEGSNSIKQQQQQQQTNIVRCNKDMIRMRQQQNMNGSFNRGGDDEESIDFNQYAADNSPIEDSLQDNKNTQQRNKVQQNNDQNKNLEQKSDVVKINPRFNMKILFDDD